MTLKEMTKRAEKIRALFRVRERAAGKEWSTYDLMMGLVGDTGDLAKLMMAKEGLRKADNLDAALAHELADCLWSLLLIADDHGVDLAAAFETTMAGLESKLAGKQ